MYHITTFQGLIEALDLNDYEIARRCGASRSTIRSLRTGQNTEPGFTLGIKLARLAGLAIPTPLRKLERAKPHR